MASKAKTNFSYVSPTMIIGSLSSQSSTVESSSPPQILTAISLDLDLRVPSGNFRPVFYFDLMGTGSGDENMKTEKNKVVAAAGVVDNNLRVSSGNFRLVFYFDLMGTGSGDENMKTEKNKVMAAAGVVSESDSSEVVDVAIKPKRVLGFDLNELPPPEFA